MEFVKSYKSRFSKKVSKIKCALKPGSSSKSLPFLEGIWKTPQPLKLGSWFTCINQPMERRRLRRGKPASMNHLSNFGGCSWTSWNKWFPVFFWFQRHLFDRKIVVKLSSKADLKTYLPCHHQQPSNNCCCQTLVPAPVASQSTKFTKCISM